MLGLGYRFRSTMGVALLTLAAARTAAALPAADPTLDAMKGRLPATSLGDRPHLCVQIAEHQLAEADKLYSAADVDQAQTKLTDVVAYSELARDYSIQTHKYQKKNKIA